MDSDQVARNLMAEILQTYCKAVLDGDVAQLDAHFDESLTWVHASAATDHKASLLNQFATGDLKFSKHEISEVQVRDLNGSLLATGQLELIRVTADTQKHFRSRFSSIWKRSGDDLRLVYWQSTRFA